MSNGDEFNNSDFVWMLYDAVVLCKIRHSLKNYDRYKDGLNGIFFYEIGTIV